MSNAIANTETSDRSRQLILALGAAEQTLERLSPVLKRAAIYERRPLDRNDKLVAEETERALREAELLVSQLKRARAALPVKAASQVRAA